MRICQENKKSQLKNLVDKIHKLIVKELKLIVNCQIKTNKNCNLFQVFLCIIKLRIINVGNLNNWHLYFSIKRLFYKILFFAYSHYLVRVYMECDCTHLNHHLLVSQKNGHQGHDYKGGL